MKSWLVSWIWTLTYVHKKQDIFPWFHLWSFQCTCTAPVLVTSCILSLLWLVLTSQVPFSPKRQVCPSVLFCLIINIHWHTELLDRWLYGSVWILYSRRETAYQVFLVNRYAVSSLWIWVVRVTPSERLESNHFPRHLNLLIFKGFPWCNYSSFGISLILMKSFISNTCKPTLAAWCMRILSCYITISVEFIKIANKSSKARQSKYELFLLGSHRNPT